MIGETLGSYEVRKRIGEGGMGEVYLAKHKHIDRMAAIKVLRPQFSAEAGLVERFFAEARSANLVKHPGIVEIYDCAVHTDGRAYIVMEYLEGQTLGAALERLGCVDEAMTIVDLSWQIATALQAAHDRDIIHRDLKPDNVFLTFLPDKGPSPVVKILDFGIAKLLHSTVKATQTGSLLGTPLYMSPEQGRGSGVVDHRTDIYSLGCIMFEMVCGRPPFVREGAGDLIIAHASETPPPASVLQPRLPPELDQLIGRMLTKNPAARPQTMREVARVLDMFRVHHSTMASTDPVIPELDEGQTNQYRPAAPPEPPSPPRPRRVAPTEILPPSSEDKPSPRSVIQSPMVSEHSWIARAQETSHDPPPKRALGKRSPPAHASDVPEDKDARERRGSLFWVGGGVLVGGLAVVVILVTNAISRPAAKPEPAPPTAVENLPSPPVPVAPPPLPSPATPALAETQPPPPAPTVAKAQPAPEKPKRAPRRPADVDPANGPGAEAMAAARRAFTSGDYIAAGIQAKRAARQGAGVRAFLLLGDSMLRLESYPEAQQAYQSALELEPGNAAAKLGLRTVKQKTSH